MARDSETGLLLRLEASLASFERQMARARQVGGSTARNIQGDFNRTTQQMAESSTRAAGAFSNVINVSRQGRAVLQNTAANIGDIAIQLESGTNAFRVAGQQIPQILGGFASLGGAAGVLLPILGTIVAVGAPLAAMFLATGDSAATAADRITQAADAVEEAGRRTDAVRTGIGALRDLEDRLSQAIVMRGINQQVVSEASIRALTAEIEARRAMLRLETVQAQQAITAARERVAALQAQANEIIATARAMPTVADLQGQLAPMSNPEREALGRQLLEDVQTFLDRHREVFLQLEAQTAQLASQEAHYEALVAAMEASADAGADLDAALGNANLDHLVAAAEALAERLGVSLEVARRIARMQNAEMLGGSSGPDSARFQVMNDRRLDPSTIVFQRTYNTPSTGGGRGRSGGGATEMSDSMRMAAEIIRQVQRETVSLTDVQAALNAELQAGRINADEYAQALAIAGERFASTNDQLRSMGELLADMAVNWNRAGDVAVGALRRITQQLLSRAFTQALERLAAGPAGGALSIIAGGLFGGGRAPSFAGGGHTGSGPRAGGVDGRGGFWAVMHPNERVEDLTLPRAMTAPRMTAAPQVSVETTIINNAGVEVEERRSVAPDGRVTQEFILNTVNRGFGEGRFDRALGGRHGLRPQGVRR